MRSLVSAIFDPMIRVLLIATGLAVILPATGDARGVVQTISNFAIFVLFLVNGMRIARADIFKGFTNWHFFLPLGIWVFGVMAMAGLGFSMLAQNGLPPLIALGFLYLGTLPSTIQSATSYTTIAGGNVALSVIGAALINIAGVFITAPLFGFLGGGAVADTGPDVIVRIALLLVLPFVIGQAVQGWTFDWIKQRRDRIVWLDRIVIAIAVYVAFSGAVEQGIGRDLSLTGMAWLVGLTIAFLLVANAGAWLASAALGLKLGDRIAFLFAGSQKSVAIGAPLAALLFPPEAAGFVIAPLLLYHLLQLMIAAPVSSRLASLARN
ncbi:bile acid:sodium symporter family protein [Parerythrobacter jejuensis]|uniref:Bile acid:sodium symporter n=1 Tax=Parerythrobacter jejuensis TaxID=795812 RepID=A0A845ARV2_9SPHN|nr:bile acid:sodium symporter family protein [Parerythrobacter jejuensis]MXP32219.1 bile acid:sodium symporter [Parerythrobacter jejuensis]